MAEKLVQFPQPSWRPSREELHEVLRGLAVNTLNMRMDCPHLQERMAERGVTMRQMLDVIRNGEVIAGPTLDQYGDWRLKLKRKSAGRRIQVVVAITRESFSPVTVI